MCMWMRIFGVLNIKNKFYERSLLAHIVVGLKNVSWCTHQALCMWNSIFFTITRHVWKNILATMFFKQFIHIQCSTSMRKMISTTSHTQQSRRTAICYGMKRRRIGRLYAMLHAVCACIYGVFGLYVNMQPQLLYKIAHARCSFARKFADFQIVQLDMIR